MQDKSDIEPPDEQPLSSEAPDAVEHVDRASDAAGFVSAQELAESAEVAGAVAPRAADADEQPADDVAGEQPDGAVADPADDLIADANAVDPKIDVSLLEAYLFSTHTPLTPGRLAELFNLESTKPIRKAIRSLNEQYEASGRCFRVEQVAGGFQLLTLPDYGESLKALHQREQDAKLTKAALETLAIIAYKQPILRADLEAIRGVASGETIRSLMEKHLVKIAGRAEEPGRPILYGTTRRFLEVFGLNSLKDLPHPDSMQGKQQQLSRAAQTLLADGSPEPTEEMALETSEADTAEAAGDVAGAGETEAAAEAINETLAGASAETGPAAIEAAEVSPIAEDGNAEPEDSPPSEAGDDPARPV